MPSTSNIPDGGSTVASRGTIMGGGAVVNASIILKQIITETIQKITGKSVAHFKDSKLLTLRIILLCPGMKQSSSVMIIKSILMPLEFSSLQISWDEETGQGNAYFTWVYGCQAGIKS